MANNLFLILMCIHQLKVKTVEGRLEGFNEKASVMLHSRWKLAGIMYIKKPPRVEEKDFPFFPDPPLYALA